MRQLVVSGSFVQLPESFPQTADFCFAAEEAFGIFFVEGQQALVRIRADIRRRGIGGGLFPAQFGRLNDDDVPIAGNNVIADGVPPDIETAI